MIELSCASRPDTDHFFGIAFTTYHVTIGSCFSFNNDICRLAGVNKKFSKASLHHLMTGELMNIPLFSVMSEYRLRFGNCQVKRFWPPSVKLSISISTSKPLT